ncbi:hypothetical protein QQF64_030061 [Cirrhinus molitorella]|uniref:Uncharacterized protein n=1 Tax=Cirrhinus molitorella TaxID=172907 RepID=A0ABR3N2L5_9TELE
MDPKGMLYNAAVVTQSDTDDNSVCSSVDFIDITCSAACRLSLTILSTRRIQELRDQYNTDRLKRRALIRRIHLQP